MLNFFIITGSTEDIEILNAGSAPMNYKLFFTDSNKALDTIKPCEESFFVLNKTLIALNSDEKTTVRVSFPVCDIPHDIKRSVIFN